MNFALWSVDSWIVADKLSTLCLETPHHRRLGALLTMKWSCKSIMHSELTREQSIGAHCVVRRRPKRTHARKNPLSNPECPFKGSYLSVNYMTIIKLVKSVDQGIIQGRDLFKTWELFKEIWYICITVS